MWVQDRIQPYQHNPFYWQYKGQPVLLLGGSVEDNLFQIPDIEAQLDVLHAVGGNYVRCTLSSRDEGDVWPFERDPITGLYDLNQPGVEYWRKFEYFLELCAARDIIVQIEVWDRFDFARAPWQLNPFNPKNNSNYTAAESGLLLDINTHPGLKENAFFRSVPALDNNTVLLPYQHIHVDRLLSIALEYGNVLYCMDNETNESPEWGAYWARYIQQQAGEAGLPVHCTEMWDAWNILDDEHLATIVHPELYTFIDGSQNNHNSADAHWDNLHELCRRVRASGHIRPMNSVKIYGANTGRYGTNRDGQERFWRNVLGGLAAARFHRPPAGLGLSEIAQAHLRSMRMLTQEVDVFACEAHNDLLQNRSGNEAHCMAQPGREYVVFFPDGGNVLLDVSDAKGSLNVRWLDIRQSQWLDADKISVEVLDMKNYARLVTPAEDGFWAALIQVKQ
ncbi:MAG: hypothetical protein JXA10_03765 [Anaerolineae bacterium]|nr:hypothetical protein [Anaerolineae bacterium]